MNLKRKRKIQKSFGDKVSSYNLHAVIQKKTAQKLCAFLPAVMSQKILEIGCGTGFLTEELQRKYPKSDILSLDISKEMITSCRQKFTGFKNIEFQVSDGEIFQSPEKFNLIVSNLSVQWFDNPPEGLQNLLRLLSDDGVLFFTAIGRDEFKEWRHILSTLKLPSGIIDIPDYDGIFFEDKKTIVYKNALDFLRHLKRTGTHQPSPNHTPLNAAQLKQACAAHDSEYQGHITWHIVFGALNGSGGALYREHDFV